MKKIILACVCFMALCTSCLADDRPPANLLEVFQQAMKNDPRWLEAVSQTLSDKEGVPISLAGLLPALTANFTPYLERQLNSGPSNVFTDGSIRGYNFQLSLTQTVFDFGKLADLASAHALSQQSSALLNVATQDLIVRVAYAYFRILSDEDNLVYLGASKKAYEKQLDQVTQQYRVGLKTITDVYTAKASYESAVASYIGAEAALANDRENLRIITGTLYPSLAKLKKTFPFVTPQPASIDQWVTKAGQQNWAIRAAQYNVTAKKDLIRKQAAGHLPVLTAGASWANQYSRTTSQEFLPQFSGSSRVQSTTGNLNLAIPLAEGGLVLAETRKAQYDYKVAVQQLEKQLRSTLAQTRQSYLNIVSGIAKIKADRLAIQSNISSLEGMRAGWHVGTETLVNVLNQQERVFEAQTQYTNDRFAWINHLLALKQAAGTLGIEDLEALNHWLEQKPPGKSLRTSPSH